MGWFGALLCSDPLDAADGHFFAVACSIAILTKFGVGKVKAK